jgi:hypothetical protein
LGTIDNLTLSHAKGDSKLRPVKSAAPTKPVKIIRSTPVRDGAVRKPALGPRPTKVVKRAEVSRTPRSMERVSKKPSSSRIESGSKAPSREGKLRVPRSSPSREGKLRSPRSAPSREGKLRSPRSAPSGGSKVHSPRSAPAPRMREARGGRPAPSSSRHVRTPSSHRPMRGKGR